MRTLENKKPITHSSSPFFSPKIQKKLKTRTTGDQFEVEADRVADKVVNHNSSGSGLLQSKENVQQKPISETISSVQKKSDKKEEEKPVQKKSDKKEEEKPVQKKSDKKEEEKPVQKKSDKKEEEKPVQKKSDKKEEEKPVQKKSDKKEEEKPIQAKCDNCEKEETVQSKDKKEEDKAVQKKEQNPDAEINDNELEGKLDHSKGGGAGLDKKTKGEMESGFGADFSDVKIHTDTNAVQMSQELGAQAFTNGNDVYFNKGKYNPDSREGKHLLAHELTHTIQQTGAVQKSVDPSSTAAEDLESPRFKGDYKLEQTHDDLDYLATGSKGEPVQKVQSGLMDLGYQLPKFGADGDFGSETRAAVFKFQSDNGLSYDGIVGVQTIGRLDDIYVGKGPGPGKDKKKKPPKKKDKKTCDITNTFHFSSDPVHIETLETDGACKSFSISLTTTRNKGENPCSGYIVEITDSAGTSLMGPTSFKIGGTVPINFTAPTAGKFRMIIGTPASCGENAFKGVGSKHRH
jgi:peptidoglycan hydrolase-like protein with peptidoglycan-binding domain